MEANRSFECRHIVRKKVFGRQLWLIKDAYNFLTLLPLKGKICDKDRLHNLWDLVQNENVVPFVQKL